MKRMSVLVILGALLVLAGRSEAAARPAASSEPAVMASAEIVPDGTSLMVIEAEPQPVLRWNPVCGFHYGRCTRNSADAKGFKVWAQRFAGFDPAQGRPLYVSRGRF